MDLKPGKVFPNRHYQGYVAPGDGSRQLPCFRPDLGLAIIPLRQVLDPSIVALRCGHPLHVECATAAVSASSSRHVRCPLCRQPVTLAGEAALLCPVAAV